MGLPTSRSTTYAPGSQVKSADLNAVQDWIVTHQSRIGALESVTRVVLAHAGRGLIAANFIAIDSSGVFIRSTTQNDRFYIPIHVESGERITAWSVTVRHGTNSTAQMAANLVRQPADGGAPINVGSLQSSVASIVLQNLVNTGLTHDVVVANAYYIYIDMLGATQNFDIFRASVTTTRP